MSSLTPSLAVACPPWLWCSTWQDSLLPTSWWCPAHSSYATRSSRGPAAPSHIIPACCRLLKNSWGETFGEKVCCSAACNWHSLHQFGQHVWQCRPDCTCPAASSQQVAMSILGALQSSRSGPGHTSGMHAQCCSPQHRVQLCPGWQPALVSLLDPTWMLYGSHQHGLAPATACAMGSSRHSGICSVNGASGSG